MEKNASTLVAMPLPALASVTPNLSPIEFLDLPVVVAESQLSVSSIYRAMKEGSFPRPYKLTGQRRVAWTRTDLERWKASRQLAGQSSAPAA